MDLSDEDAQKVLDNSVKDPNGDKRYGVKDGKIYEFQPTRPDVYHGYPERDTQDIPISVRRELRDRGLISKNEYNKMMRPKK